MAGIAAKIHRFLVASSDVEDRCEDLREAACEAQPRNFLLHLLALTGTKTGDALMDPKLVLSWLLGTLGAPAAMVGWLVPIREAGALLPQLFTADRLRRMTRRKWAWSAGSAIQGAAVAGMAVSAWRLQGAAAGWSILLCLTIFALARSVCSVTYKDVLGKTIARNSRGTVTGSASTAAAGGALLFGALLSSPWVPVSLPVIIGALGVGAGLWLVAAVLFSLLMEPPGERGRAASGLRDQLGWLRRDPQLAWFIIVRGLLLGTALAPPYLVVFSPTEQDGALGTLGPLVLAAAIAPLASSYAWGRFADHSSRRVLAAAGWLATLPLGAAAIIGWLRPALLEGVLLPTLLFLLMIAYQGVRLGRSTHLVDMAGEEQRAAYTALSNTIIGVLLLAGGLFGLLASAAGPEAVLGAFAVMSLAAGGLALGLEEVQ